MNKVFLIGRLTRNPELRYTGSNTAVASFSIAVNRPFTGQNGERQADFINVVVWRRQAENVKNYLSQGSQVAIEGRLQSRSYDGPDGKRHYVTEVIADNVEFIGAKRNPDGNQETQTTSAPAQNDASAEMPVFSDFPQEEPTTTDVSGNPFADFGSSIEISDDELPF